MFCVHTVRLFQSLSRTAHASFGGLRLFSSNVQHHPFSEGQLAAVALMLDEEDKIAALYNEKKFMWVHKCFRSRKTEGEYWTL
jgi:hypothetical protein